MIQQYDFMHDYQLMLYMQYKLHIGHSKIEDITLISAANYNSMLI